MTLVWGTDHVNALVNVSACYIPFRFAELSTDVTNNRGLFGRPQKLNRRPIAQRARQPQKEYPYEALTSVPFALPRWRKLEAIALRHLVGNRSTLDVAVDQCVGLQQAIQANAIASRGV